MAAITWLSRFYVTFLSANDKQQLFLLCRARQVKIFYIHLKWNLIFILFQFTFVIVGNYEFGSASYVDFGNAIITIHLWQAVALGSRASWNGSEYKFSKSVKWEW